MTALPRPTKPQSSRRTRYLKRWNTLKNERNSWVDHWRELTENASPRTFRYLSNDRTQRGTKKNSKIINGKPIWALRTLAAGMMAGCSSPSRPWFRFTTGNPELTDNQVAKEYLAILEDRVREALQKSNFYNALHQVYEDLGLIGTSALYVEADAEDIIRAYNFPVGQYALANSDRNAVDTVFRELDMTVGQVVDKFGFDKCSAQIRDKYTNDDIDFSLKVLHVLEPNRGYMPGKIGAAGKKIASCWMEVVGSDEIGFLREAGFDEFPVMAPRWKTTGEDVYGSSPGMDALGDCKALQLLEKRKAQALDKVVTPPMVGPAALASQRISLLPGETTYSDASGPGNQFRPAFEVNPNTVAIVGAEIQVNEYRIDRAWFADLWLMISQGEGVKTATEIIERREEKLLQLGPVMERLQDELYDPAIARVFLLLAEAGKLPPPPPELQGKDLRVEYISIMAQAQKLLGTTAVERLTSFVANLASIAPQVLDKIDLDKTVDNYAGMLGVPPNMVRTEDDVIAIRESRAKAEQQAQQAAQAQAAAGVAKDLSQADMSGDNALTSMLKGMGAA